MAEVPAEQKVITEEMASEWARNWDPEIPSDVLYLEIDECTDIHEEAARVFGDFKFVYGGKSFAKQSSVHLQIKRISDAAAAHLSRCRGKLVFGKMNGGLRILSDNAARSLASMKKGRLVVEAWGGLPATVKAILKASGHIR